MKRPREDPRQGELFSGSPPLATVPAEAFGDQEDRTLAATAFDRPILLVAGAGTGKTGTLTARILTWALGPGWERARPAQAEPSEDATAAEVLRGIVAITFTEAAAAEMSARVALALARIEALTRSGALDAGALPSGLVARCLPREAPVLHARARALRASLDHLNASTIHAFCRRLLAAHPLEAGMDPDFVVDASGTRIALAVREVIEDELRAGLGAGDEAHAADLLALAHRGRGPREIEDDLATLIDAGARALDFAGPALDEATRTRLVEAVLAGTRTLWTLAAPMTGSTFKTRFALEALQGTLALEAEAGRAPRDGAGFDGLCAELRRLWQGEASERLSQWSKGRLIKAESQMVADEPAFRAASQELVLAVRALIELDRAGLEAAHRVAGRLLGRVEARLRAAGVATFGDLLWSARTLLREHPEIAAQERARIRQLLVDEFQDTDEVQCEIVGALGLEGEPGVGPCLFVVGDPKQSIFAWRNADLGAFDAFAARMRAAGGRTLQLARNFRSVPEVLTEVERVVAPVMEAVPGLQPAFAPLEPHRDSHAGPAVEYWVTWSFDAQGAVEPVGRGHKLTGYAGEARALAADLLRQHARGGLAWKDAGVIFRALTEIEPYLRELRRLHIPYEVQSDRKYYQRREVIDAGALVRCVLDPNDHLALVTLLRSPMVGMPDAALFPLWERGFPGLVSRLRKPDAELLGTLEGALAEVARLLPDDVPGLAEVRGWPVSTAAALRALARSRASFRTLPADAWLDELRALFLPEAVESARFLGTWRLANLQRFFRELLRTLEERGGDVQSLLSTLRASVARDDKSEASRPADSGRDTVKILTIHGAKGLEFRQVYFPQLHKGEFDGERSGFDRRDQRVSYRLFGLSNPAWFETRARRAATEAAERVRLLYVALTRARDRLVIAGAFPPERRARSWTSAQNFAELFESHPAIEPALATLAARARAGEREPFVDAAGARWTPTAWIEEAGGTAPRDARAPGTPLTRVRAEAQALGAARAGATLRQARATQSRASEEVTHERGEARASGSAGIGRDAAQAAGTAVHRALEHLDLSSNPAAALARARAELVEDGELDAEARARAVELLERFERGPLCTRLFALAEDVLARELAVLLPPGEGPEDPVGFVAGAIDLLYRDPASEELVVADYKTDRLDSPAELEARAREYGPQGEVYTRALQAALGLARPPRFELWFLHAGEVRTS